jgi:putative ABC transport system ATP-binding protein
LVTPELGETGHESGQAGAVADGPVVAVEGLSRVFPGPPEVMALAPCSFTIGRGEMVAITGPSGSGKTTLLSLLGLLDAPTAGSYRLDGLDVAALSDDERAAVRSRRIGFVFQAFHLIGYRSVIDNVELGVLYHGTGARERRRAAVEVIERVGLAERADALCSHLSGGEKQRVAIARTLVRRPALVLCDEPTGNLDTANSESILAIMDELHGEGLTIVVITHDPTVAARAGRNLQIRDGQLSEPAGDNPIVEPAADDAIVETAGGVG